MKCAACGHESPTDAAPSAASAARPCVWKCAATTAVTAQAQGGEILVSSLVKELPQSTGDIRFEPAREMALKGLSGTYLVSAIAWKT